MILLTVPILFIGAIAVLVLQLRRQPSRRSLWRWALGIGLVVGVIRAAGASAGWYVVERTGGPLQVPAYALAMLSWPEAALLAQRRLGRTPPEFFATLSLLLITTTTIGAIIVALVADVARTRRGANARRP